MFRTIAPLNAMDFSSNWRTLSGTRRAHFHPDRGYLPHGEVGLGQFGISGGCAYQCKLRSVVSRGSVKLRSESSKSRGGLG